MTGIIPNAPPEYDQGILQQIVQTIEGRFSDLELVSAMRPIVLFKEVDETKNSDDTLAADAFLAFPVEANKGYRFRFVVFYDTHASADFKYDVNGPSSPDLIHMVTRHVAPGASAFAGVANQTSFGFGPTAITETSGTPGVIMIDGLLQNGANAGAVAFRWAQNTENAGDTIVRGGSFLEWSQL